MMSAAKNTSASSALLPEKGLDNRPGQNNCFLNVCIQALWHLGAFRSQFLSSKAHIHNETSCIYCVLQVYPHHFYFLFLPFSHKHKKRQQSRAETICLYLFSERK